MDANERALLYEAVNTLVDDQDAAKMYKQLLLVYDAASKKIPVRLTGRPAVLNPLLELMLEDYSVACRVLDLVDRKRDANGLTPLDDGAFARKPYMADLMASKRERQRRVVEALNMLRPAKDALKGTARMEFERVIAANWQGVKAEREEEARERLGRRLTVDERKRIKDQLWADVEAEVQALEDFTQQELRKPLLERSAGFEFKLKPKKG